MGASIVMLIASGLSGSGLSAIAIHCALRPVVPERTGVHRPAHRADVRSRQAEVPARKPSPATWRFRDRPAAAVPDFMFRLTEARLSFLSFPAAARRPSGNGPFAASAVRQIQSGDILRRVFRYCCGHRCLIEPLCFPICFSGFPLQLQVRFHRLDELKLRSKAESHKRARAKLSTDRQIGGG